MNRHTQHADVRDIERMLFTRRPTPVRDAMLAVVIGVGLAVALFF
jgi:hypothetical protein